MSDIIYSDMYGTWVEVPLGYWEGDDFIITGYKRVYVTKRQKVTKLMKR